MKNEWIAKVGSQQQDVKHLGLKAAPRTAMSGRGGVAGGMGCLGKSFVGNSDKVYGAVGDGWMDFFLSLTRHSRQEKEDGRRNWTVRGHMKIGGKVARSKRHFGEGDLWGKKSR